MSRVELSEITKEQDDTQCRQKSKPPLDSLVFVVVS